MGTSVAQTFTFTSSPPVVFDAFHMALASIATVQQIDAGRQYMDGTVGWSAWSWGERIQVWVRPGSPETSVTVESKCRLRTQFIDWGRNRRNVDRLLKTATDLLPAG